MYNTSSCTNKQNCLFHCNQERGKRLKTRSVEVLNWGCWKSSHLCNNNWLMYKNNRLFVLHTRFISCCVGGRGSRDITLSVWYLKHCHFHMPRALSYLIYSLYVANHLIKTSFRTVEIKRLLRWRQVCVLGQLQVDTGELGIDVAPLPSNIGLLHNAKQDSLGRTIT